MFKLVCEATSLCGNSDLCPYSWNISSAEWFC